MSSFLSQLKRESEAPQSRPWRLGGCRKCGQAKAILKGFGLLAYDRIVGKKPPQMVLDRAEICNACPYRTWLTVRQWGKGIAAGTIPINHTPGTHKKLWCSICKCCIEAKIRVDTEHCAQNKW